MSVPFGFGRYNEVNNYMKLQGKGLRLQGKGLRLS